MENIIYLVLYNESIKKLIEMEQKQIIQLSTETKKKLTKYNNEFKEITGNKISILLDFKSYDFETMEIKENPITIELFKIFLKHGNKNLMYGLKIKEV